MVVHPPPVAQEGAPEDAGGDEPGTEERPKGDAAQAGSHAPGNLAQPPSAAKLPRSAIALATAALLLGPIAFVLERGSAMPITLRDRAVPLAAVVAVAASVATGLAWRSAATRWRRILVAGPALTAIGLAIAIGLWIDGRYTLPASSPRSGVGQSLPAATLVDETGHPYAVAQLHEKPTLLVWFRGSWCPYCRKQLAELAGVAREYEEHIRVVAVTSEDPPPLLAMQRELRLPFHVLSDPMGSITSRCELTHCVAILDRDGVLRWGVTSGNWDRLPPLALAQATVRRGGRGHAPPSASSPDDGPDLAAPTAPVPALDPTSKAGAALQSVRRACPQVEVDGYPPTCRVRGQCQTGTHELDCHEPGGLCKCTTTSSTNAPTVPYDDSFCVGSDRPTSGQERFAAAALACGFPL